MIPEWTLLIVTAIGIVTADFKATQVSMTNREACETSAKWFAENSPKHFGFICISSTTGETFRFLGAMK